MPRPSPAPLARGLRTLTRPADILLGINEENGGAALQNRIAQICEKWWQQERPGKETLVPQTACYLLLRSLAADAKPTGAPRCCTGTPAPGLMPLLSLSPPQTSSASPACRAPLHCSILTMLGWRCTRASHSLSAERARAFAAPTT